MFASIYLTPLFLSSVRHYSALQIGETMFVQGLAMFLSGPLIGYVSRRLDDLRWLGGAGFGLVAISCWGLTHLTAESGFWTFAWPQIIRGIGLMMAFSAVMQPSLQALPFEQVHAGAALFNTMRNPGGAFGIAALTTVQGYTFLLHRQELYAATDPSNPHVAAMLERSRAYLEQAGAVDPDRQALMRYASLLDREALVMSFNDQFLVLALIIAASAIGIMLSGPRKRPASYQREAPAR